MQPRLTREQVHHVQAQQQQVLKAAPTRGHLPQRLTSLQQAPAPLSQRLPQTLRAQPAQKQAPTSYYHWL